MELLNNILDASVRIKPFIRETYLNQSQFYSELIGGDVWFKLENHQVTGSFKARGAVNKLLSLSKEEKEGVISASTGNHGAAVAYAAKQLDIPCTIYVPQNASSTKLKNMKNYGARINIHGQDCVDAEKKPEMNLKR